MNASCPICGGTGKHTFLVKHTQTNRSKIVTEWCLCMKSRFISDQPDYKLLTWLGDNYIPLEQIDSQLIFDIDNLNKSPNLVIKSPDYETFCLNIKSIIMRHRFQPQPPLIYCCRSIDLVHNFYVQQDDGSSPHLSEAEKYDLLVFTLDTEERNLKLPSCVAQVVYTRKVIRKPTWIYYSKSSLSDCQEHSSELSMFLKEYREVILKGSIKTNSKQAAANFNR